MKLDFDVPLLQPETNFIAAKVPIQQVGYVVEIYFWLHPAHLKRNSWSDVPHIKQRIEFLSGYHHIYLDSFM